MPRWSAMHGHTAFACCICCNHRTRDASSWGAALGFSHAQVQRLEVCLAVSVISRSCRCAVGVVDVSTFWELPKPVSAYCWTTSYYVWPIIRCCSVGRDRWKAVPCVFRSWSLQFPPPKKTKGHGRMKRMPSSLHDWVVQLALELLPGHAAGPLRVSPQPGLAAAYKMLPKCGALQSPSSIQARACGSPQEVLGMGECGCPKSSKVKKPRRCSTMPSTLPL